MRVAAPAFLGALGFDTIDTIKPERAKALRAWGMKFAIRYLGSLTSAEVDTLHAAGLAVMPVTYGNSTAFDGPGTVAKAKAAGIAPGTTVWLDLEGQQGKRSAEELIRDINAWHDVVSAAGFNTGIYVGAGHVLTSIELGALKVTRYWHACSILQDRNGAIVSPVFNGHIGWCMYQLALPNKIVAGEWVDVDVIQQDFKGRVPSWCISVPTP